MSFLGYIFSRDSQAYQYFQNSTGSFPCGEVFNNILRKNGFITLDDFSQTLGVSSIYFAQKP